MSKGRNTQVLAVRVPDNVVATLKERAKAKGVGYTVLARHFIQEKLGLPKR
jgi:predicted DNA binding CopG/RHH family protein